MIRTEVRSGDWQYDPSRCVPDFASGVNAITHIPIFTPPLGRLSAGDRLAAQWQKRRREALDAVSDALRDNRLDGPAAADLAQIMHNIAGTAGMFGECELGIRAGALEQALKNGETGVRSELAASFLRAA